MMFLFITHASFASDYLSWEVLEQKFSEVSDNGKALSHVKCFFEKNSGQTFQLKAPEDPTFFNRCFANPEIKLESQRVFALVDYTKKSDEQRMFIVDRLTGAISTMAVAHGRFRAGFFNRKMSENKNTVKEIKYYSNTKNSMASSSGFFIGGQDYEADDFGRSLIIHGLERDINDNACERDVVIHKHFLVTKKKAHMLSSGCLMVSPQLIDHVINLLRGRTGDDLKMESGGSLIFIYGPREADWQAGSCPGTFTPVQ